MNKLELKEIVQDQRKKGLDERIVKREVFKDVEKLKRTPFIIIISGIRRSGKSTLLHTLRDEEEGYFLNLDDERLVRFEIDDFQKLYEIFLELQGEKKIFYFDEIQNVNGWERFVRRLRDSGKKVYITGSNASMLSRELGTHLTGRYIQLTIYPFSFREFLLLKNINVTREMLYSTEGKGRIKKLFNEYMQKGGIPEYLKTDNNEYLKTLYDNIIYRDILVRYKLTNEKTMKELVNLISSNISKEISFNSLKKTLGLGSPTTVREYFNYLENSFLVFLVPKFSYSLKKQIYASKKVYFIDTGLALNTGFRVSGEFGRLLENMVFIELKRKGMEIFYYKEKKECDFVFRHAGKFNAIQVCYDFNEENKEREIRGLIEALNEFRLSKGLILTYDQEDEFTVEGKKIIIKPVWKWLLEEYDK